MSFGEEKRGFPNQFVAAELAQRMHAELRWSNTGDQEYHTKLVLLQKPSRMVVHAGSANLDRLSLSNTNLETNIRIAAPPDSAFSRDVIEYTERIRHEPYSVPADGGDSSPLKYWDYRLQEATGLATF